MCITLPFRLGRRRLLLSSSEPGEVGGLEEVLSASYSVISGSESSPASSSSSSSSSSDRHFFDDLRTRFDGADAFAGALRFVACFFSFFSGYAGGHFCSQVALIRTFGLEPRV